MSEGWRTIESCPPRQPVIVGDLTNTGAGYHNGNGQWFVYGSTIPMETPTHWMPYPDPPTENPKYELSSAALLSADDTIENLCILMGSEYQNGGEDMPREWAVKHFTERKTLVDARTILINRAEQIEATTPAPAEKPTNHQ